MSAMYCQTFVSPGMGATLQHLRPMRELITLLLPLLGKPITPTLIWRLSCGARGKGELE